VSELSIGGYDIHPLAAKLPLMDGVEFDDLVASVAARGLQKKVKLDAGGRVVDGRNRLRACIKAGKAVEFERLPEDTDIVSLILDENVFRRHLTPAQRAMIAADLATLPHGRPAKDNEGMSAGAAADRLGVNRSSVSSAKKITRQGTEELQDAVRNGKMDLKSAAAVADKPAEEQHQAVTEAAATGKGKGKKRAKETAANFSRDKWRSKAEVTISKLVTLAPEDMRDWAKGTLRDVTGGRLRKEVQREELVPDGDDAALYDADDVIARIEGVVKEIPITQRKDIKQQIGAHFIGKKPAEYLPVLDESITELERVAVVIAEMKHRLTGQSDAVTSILRWRAATAHWKR